jgi:hypothetical protein
VESAINDKATIPSHMSSTVHHCFMLPPVSVIFFRSGAI